jgi:hypothetical protein
MDAAVKLFFSPAVGFRKRHQIVFANSDWLYIKNASKKQAFVIFVVASVDIGDSAFFKIAIKFLFVTYNYHH